MSPTDLFILGFGAGVLIMAVIAGALAAYAAFRDFVYPGEDRKMRRRIRKAWKEHEQSHATDS